ncbi:MAG: pyridoxal phosphate-dependent aminotransferase [Myxococcota bacterium]|nr:pyridoxal phosphate-dependent aminotransferase [Myxococcota bacterium]
MSDSTPDLFTNSFRSVPRTGVIYVMAEAREAGFRYGHPDWCNLGQGAPETGALPGSWPRIEQIDLTDQTHEYSPVAGLWELREAVAKLYNERYRKGQDSQYTAENVAISSGGRAGLTRIVASLGSIHLGHILPDYTAYEELLDIFRAFVPIPIVLSKDHGFRLSPQRLRSEIVGKGLGAVLLSNPCNPTGTAIAGDDLAACVRTATKLSCTLILDEFYSHYSYGGRGTPALSAAAHVQDVNQDPVLIVDGLTKNWRYPGWRLSWTVGPKSVIERIASAGSFLDGGPPHPLQKAAVALLSLEAANTEAQCIQEVFGHKRNRVIERLKSIGLTLENDPAGAFYCFASLANLPPSLQDGMAFFRACLAEKVIVVPGAFFDVNPGKRRSHIPSRLRGYVRISYGPDLSQLETGLDRIESLVKAARE